MQVRAAVLIADAVGVISALRLLGFVVVLRWRLSNDFGRTPALHLYEKFMQQLQKWAYASQQETGFRFFSLFLLILGRG